jgi:hypothetical protein
VPENDCCLIDKLFMKKKIIIPFLIILAVFVSCKKELAKEPKHLIEKEKMVDIMYDLSLLGAMRSQNAVFLDSFKNNSNEYIYKKYKIDSIQFAQSNIYYAADFKEYKKMYEQVKLRLEKNKKLAEAAVKAEKKKTALLEKKNKKLKEKKVNDSIKKVNDSKKAAKLKMAREMDSLKKIVAEEKKRRTQIKD